MPRAYRRHRQEPRDAQLHPPTPTASQMHPSTPHQTTPTPTPSTDSKPTPPFTGHTTHSGQPRHRRIQTPPNATPPRRPTRPGDSTPQTPTTQYPNPSPATGRRNRRKRTSSGHADTHRPTRRTQSRRGKTSPIPPTTWPTKPQHAEQTHRRPTQTPTDTTPQKGPPTRNGQSTPHTPTLHRVRPTPTTRGGSDERAPVTETARPPDQRDERGAGASSPRRYQRQRQPRRIHRIKPRRERRSTTLHDARQSAPHVTHHGDATRSATTRRLH